MRATTRQCVHDTKVFSPNQIEDTNKKVKKKNKKSIKNTENTQKGKDIET